jgi:hypothetical protein
MPAIPRYLPRLNPATLSPFWLEPVYPQARATTFKQFSPLVDGSARREKAVSRTAGAGCPQLFPQVLTMLAMLALGGSATGLRPLSKRVDRPTPCDDGLGTVKSE